MLMYCFMLIIITLFQQQLGHMWASNKVNVCLHFCLYCLLTIIYLNGADPICFYNYYNTVYLISRPRTLITPTLHLININDTRPLIGKGIFYLTTHSTHFTLRLYGVIRTVKDHFTGYSFRLTARGLYAPSHRQDDTYHGLCYTSRGALAGTRNSSMGPPHEGSIRRPIAP